MRKVEFWIPAALLWLTALAAYGEQTTATVVPIDAALTNAASAFGSPPGRRRGTSDGQRRAAAATKRAQGMGTRANALSAAPAGTPDYFGTDPNYANSPLPAGPVGAVALTSGGLGYCPNPLVTLTDLYGLGTGAVLNPATVGPGGVISPLTIASAGAGYVAPVVTITDCAGGVGSGASATVELAAGLGYTGGLRKFVDPLPTLPTATPDTVKYPGSDYYEIELVEYAQRMHTDLPATTLRGYRQTNVTPMPAPSYLGPLIVAQRDRPTRIKFTNHLPVGVAGALFLPTDTTMMGAGSGYDPLTNTVAPYPQNRGTMHLHGGFTPWISDGTPHQWVTPAAETGNMKTGVSTRPVPDMPVPAGDSMTFYWPNQQSGRLMFYHDHSYGITRLNVYAGEAAVYLLVDPTERKLTDGTIAGIPLMADLPLVIQDKSFVWGTPPVLAANGSVAKRGTGTWAVDPTWKAASAPGNLWFPHVYMPNQNPWDMSGANAMGRWDYALWFWPPYTGVLAVGTLPNPYYDPANAPWQPPEIPGTPNPSNVPESFMDTPVVNGEAYPTLNVDPKPYRFRVLNASNDRFLNLSLFLADPAVTTADGRLNTEVKMVPFNTSQHHITPFPSTWYTTGLNFVFDDRMGGVPDPTTRGPAMIQIGTEGGLLPAPAIILNQPVNYTYNRRNIVVLSVAEKALFMGPAERADLVIDFANFAGKTLILYNDSPAPVPANDQRYDYYTGAPNQTETGGAPPTLAGYGPNTRTIMQIVVGGTGGLAPVDDLNPTIVQALTTALPAAFAATQRPVVVPQHAYNAVYPGSAVAKDVVGANLSTISATSLAFTPLGSAVPLTLNMKSKAIQELFETGYGRMNSTLGVELPFTNGANQTTIPFDYVDPPTEFFDTSSAVSAPTAGDGTQIWKITHNGVDTHAVHFHLFDVQVVNRVGWDGAITRPDANELGWKDTVRMNPLEDVIVAMRPTMPRLPFGVDDSIRLLDVTMPPGTSTEFSGIDGNGNPVSVINRLFNFRWEYVWHCHLLGHEENDMMRPMVLSATSLLPDPPSAVTYQLTATTVALSWADPTPFNYKTGLPTTTLGNPSNEIGFRIERAAVAKNNKLGFYSAIGVIAPANQTAVSFPAASGTWSYRVVAFNAAGSAASPGVPSPAPSSSPASPTSLQAVLQAGPRIALRWSDNSNNETGFAIDRQVAAGAFTALVRVGANVTTYTDATAKAGTSYAYQLKAVNAAGSSPDYASSPQVAVVVPLAPSAMTADRVVVGPIGDSVALRWTDNATDEDSFLIQSCAGAAGACANPGAVWSTAAVEPANTIASMLNRPRRTTATYRVRAVNLAGPSLWSSSVNVVFP